MASIYGAKSGNGWQLRLDYTVTQNVAANQSTVSMTLYLYANTTGSYNQEDNSAYYVIQGSRVYAKYSYNSPAWYTLGSRSVKSTPCSGPLRRSVTAMPSNSTSAPMEANPARWISTGRGPRRQPPGRGSRTYPARQSSGAK